MEEPKKPADEETSASATTTSKTPEVSPDEKTPPVDGAEAAADSDSESAKPADGEKPEVSDAKSEPVVLKPNSKDRFKDLWWKLRRKKAVLIPLLLIVILGGLLAVPVTRYAVLGTFLQQNFKVVVLDKSSNKPVSNVVVAFKGQSTKTDAKGAATFKVKVGSSTLTATKKYYKTTSVSTLAPIKQKDANKVYIVATGRQVPVVVVNKITGKPVAGALVSAAGTETKTDKEGKAVIVLPANLKISEAKIKTAGYNDATGSVVVTEQADKANTFAVTPAGKVYFLSKLSGKIDVVKTDLDGTNRQTVLAGTGKEDSTDTILLASRDWKYLALKSKRSGGDYAKLFLIDATNGDKLTTMDEGNASFSLVGWSDHRFAYQVDRKVDNQWQDKAQALKTYDATSGKLTTVDETEGAGSSGSDYVFNQFGSIYILNNELVYTKNWYGYNYSGNQLNGKSASLISVKPDGTSKHSVKDFPAPSHSLYTYASYTIGSKLYEPQGLYVQVPSADAGGDDTYYEYEGGKLTAKSDVTDETFNNTDYPTYLASPSGNQTFWTDARDGKNVLFVGDADGKNEKQVATLSDYSNYGWYSDDYLLVSKNASELYIMPVSGSAPTKISDYHKPNYNFRGYGGGYGGL